MSPVTSPKEHRSILVSRLRFLGDVVLTTPLLRALRRAFPQAGIAYLAESPYIEVLVNHPDVDTLLPLHRQSRSAQLSTLRQLRRAHFDLTIDLFGNARSALLLWLTGARQRVGFDYRGRRLLYTTVVRRDARPKSAIEFHLETLRPLGVAPAGLETHLATSPDEDAWAVNYLHEKGVGAHERLAVVHAGASWPAKRWFAERFGELARRMGTELGTRVLLTTGPGEEELVARVAQVAPEAVVLEVLPIRRVMAVVKRCQVLVANDCGILHLGPALGTPTIGIFGPGEPEIWFPYSPAAGHYAVHQELDCSRCQRDFCEELRCMAAIQVDEVLAAVAHALQQGAARRPTVYTVGHSSLSLAEFVARLRAHGIRRVVDVRRFPTSRAFPHFSRDALAATLPAAGIDYRWLGQGLGAFRSGGYQGYMQTPDFAAALAELKSLAGELRTAVMCSEALFFRCHRRFIAEELVRQGWRVVHIIDESHTREHRLRQAHHSGQDMGGGSTDDQAEGHR
ncbi:MAG: glycosyltransferase family 9 protein [bacterium]|nr:glycosyltransferase family 9 protein [bacterium]